MGLSEARVSFEKLGPLSRGSLRLTQGSYTVITGAPLSGKSLVLKLLYLLRMPVQPLPALPYQDVFKQNMEAVFEGGVAGNARVEVEGCGARLLFDSGSVTLETRFRLGERVERDERVLESIKRFCFEGLGRSFYRGDTQRCIAEMKVSWSAIIVHEALTCNTVKYGVDAETGLPRAPTPRWVGGERVCMLLAPEQCRNAVYTVQPLEFTAQREGLAARLEKLDRLAGLMARGLMGGGDVANYSYQAGGLRAAARAMPLSILFLAPLLSELGELLSSGEKGFMLIEEPGLGLHPAQARLVAWLLLRAASWGHSIAYTTSSEALLAEVRLQYLLARLYSRRPATASEYFAEVAKSLGVGIEAREAARLAKSILPAASRLQLVVVEDGEARLVDPSVLEEDLPGVSKSIVEQVEMSARLLAELG